MSLRTRGAGSPRPHGASCNGQKEDILRALWLMAWRHLRRESPDFQRRLPPAERTVSWARQEGTFGRIFWAHGALRAARKTDGRGATPLGQVNQALGCVRAWPCPRCKHLPRCSRSLPRSPSRDTLTFAATSFPAAVPTIAATSLAPAPSTSFADGVAARLLPTRTFSDLSINASIQQACDTRPVGAHVYIAPLPWRALLPHSHHPRTPRLQRVSPLHLRRRPRHLLHRLQPLHPCPQHPYAYAANYFVAHLTWRLDTGKVYASHFLPSRGADGAERD